MPKIKKKKPWQNPPEGKTPLFVRSELDEYGLDVYEFRVLAHVARRESKNRGCYATQESIADTCKMSQRKAHEALQVLYYAGLVTKKQQIGSSNIYRIAPGNQWKHPDTLEKIRQDRKKSKGKKTDQEILDNGEVETKTTHE